MPEAEHGEAAVEACYPRVEQGTARRRHAPTAFLRSGSFIE
jgi:hypothetical protein